jgi:hypothetical protein
MASSETETEGAANDAWFSFLDVELKKVTFESRDLLV